MGHFCILKILQWGLIDDQLPNIDFYFTTLLCNSF